MRSQSSHENLYTQQQHMGMYTIAPQYQPPTLYSNGPSVMTPTGSPRPTYSQKPAIILDTDFDSSYFPSTPPLSTSGSTVGSPKNYDGLQTPMNPMFSGLDESETIKDTLEPAEACVLDWSSCGSPPMTPSKWMLFYCCVYFQLPCTIWPFCDAHFHVFCFPGSDQKLFRWHGKCAVQCSLVDKHRPGQPPGQLRLAVWRGFSD